MKIDKVTLEIKGVTLELTPEECLELKNILDKIVDKKPEFTISSQWPIGGVINTPFVTVPLKVGDQPVFQPIITCTAN